MHARPTLGRLFAVVAACSATFACASTHDGAAALAPEARASATPSNAPRARLVVRVCPESELRTYPAESRRNVQSAVLQHLLVENRGAATVDVDAVEISLMRGDRAVDVRRLEGPELAEAAARGVAAQGAGMMALVPFQFCGGRLIPEGTKLAGPRLLPGQAMLVSAQPFVFRGARDAVRVLAHGTTTRPTSAVVEPAAPADAIDASLTLPIRTRSSATRFVFPMTGRWFVAVGPTFHTAHRWALPEEFGFDFVQLGAEGATHAGVGARFVDYFAYGKPVRAAAAGRVIAAVNDVAEVESMLRGAGEDDEAYGARVQRQQLVLLKAGGAAAAGDHVLLDHGASEYSLYAHLQPGSVSVKVGEAVVAGQIVGRLGSSGNSTEPHLHFQVCDRPDPLSCAGVPVEFADVRLPLADEPRPLQSGDLVEAR